MIRNFGEPGKIMAKTNKQEKVGYIVDVTFLENPEDSTTYILCKKCLPSISDFAKITKKRKTVYTNCDRCG